MKHNIDLCQMIVRQMHSSCFMLDMRVQVSQSHGVSHKRQHRKLKQVRTTTATTAATSSACATGRPAAATAVRLPPSLPSSSNC